MLESLLQSMQLSLVELSSLPVQALEQKLGPLCFELSVFSLLGSVYPPKLLWFGESYEEQSAKGEKIPPCKHPGQRW